MARPTKFDDDVAERICEAVSIGSTWSLAASAGGVDPETLRAWKARGRAGEEPFSAFLGRLKSAEAEAASRALRVIRDAANDGTWQAAAWLLERRYPRSYGRRDVRADITQKLAPVSAEEAKEKIVSMVRDVVAGNADLRAELLIAIKEEGDHDPH